MNATPANHELWIDQPQRDLGDDQHEAEPEKAHRHQKRAKGVFVSREMLHGGVLIAQNRGFMEGWNVRPGVIHVGPAVKPSRAALAAIRILLPVFTNTYRMFIITEHYV